MHPAPCHSETQQPGGGPRSQPGLPSRTAQDGPSWGEWEGLKDEAYAPDACILLAGTTDDRADFQEVLVSATHLPTILPASSAWGPRPCQPCLWGVRAPRNPHSRAEGSQEQSRSPAGRNVLSGTRFPGLDLVPLSGSPLCTCVRSARQPPLCPLTTRRERWALRRGCWAQEGRPGPGAPGPSLLKK